MIKKLRKRLIILFLCTTMLTFTIAMAFIASNTIDKIQQLEMDYANNMTDSIIQQVREHHGIDKTTLSTYTTKFQCWIILSDGKTTWHSPQQLDTPLDILLSQITSKKNTLFDTKKEINSTKLSKTDKTLSFQIENSKAKDNNSEDSNNEYTRSIYSIIGQNKERYYAVQSIFDINNANMNTYDLLILCPQSSIWTIMKNYCNWYPILWIGVFVVMYFLSHFLIKKAILPVENAMESQKNFIASASHELKTPLSVIQVNAETLHLDRTITASPSIEALSKPPNMDITSSPTFIQKQKIILDECTRMTKLITSMLALASSDAGSWKMNMHETDIDTLLIETWEEWNENAYKKNIKLNLNLDEHYPKTICDKERIIQALGILLDNAITYTSSASSIEMGAQVNEKKLSFYIIDHGCGIADKDKEKIFDRFYSCDSSRTDKNHYGLGLSIAKEIVKLHHGNITVKDTEGGGCTFKIHIPLSN